MSSVQIYGDGWVQTCCSQTCGLIVSNFAKDMSTKIERLISVCPIVWRQNRCIVKFESQYKNYVKEMQLEMMSSANW